MFKQWQKCFKKSFKFICALQVDIQAAPKKDKPSSKTTVIKAAPVSKFAGQAPMSRRDKRVGAMNEFVQTDMKKGVADSAQEATVRNSHSVCFLA